MGHSHHTSINRYKGNTMNVPNEDELQVPTFDESVPAWLRAKVEQRLVELIETFDHMDSHKLFDIRVPLNVHADNLTDVEHDEWERTCACCGKTFPLAEILMGHILGKPPLQEAASLGRLPKSGIGITFSFDVCTDEHM